MYSLYDALDYYGFSTEEQKMALESLMQQASILGSTESIHDKFPSRENYDRFVEDIIEFVEQTQQHFVIRTGNQERWEVKPHEWMEHHQSENSKLLGSLGMLSEIKPVQSSVDSICVLGGAMQRMKVRMDYAASLINSGFIANNLILLAGERYVTIGVDGTGEELNEIAASYKLGGANQLTETNLIEEVHKKSRLHGALTTYIIDTPKRDLPRPTTQTTIQELISWLKDHHDIKSITFVSNQPYVKYQNAVINEVMRNAQAAINFEVVGSAYTESNLQPTFEALGSFIFAATPEVLIKLGGKINSPALIAPIERLYKAHPLVYSNLQSIIIHEGIPNSGAKISYTASAIEDLSNAMHTIDLSHKQKYLDSAKKNKLDSAMELK
jgi:hypothetical protein